jgi:type VI secretion system protein ImpB
MAESNQHWLDRNRPPRVQITYDVETGNAIEKKEIPFVVGVLSDLSAGSKTPLPKLKERKFVEIDRDNFNDVLASVKPEATVKVKNELTDDATKQLVETLIFTHIDDFRPERIVERVKPLAELLRARERLNDLLAKLEGNDELSSALRQVIANTEALSKVNDDYKASKG